MTSPAGAAMQAYRDARMTVSPAQQVALLLEGVSRRLHEAELAIARGAIEPRFRAIEGAQKILVGLQNALDFERGGAIASQLDRWYSYLLRRMVQVNTRNDAEICRELAGHCTTMGAAWAEIARGETDAPPPRSEEKHAPARI